MDTAELLDDTLAKVIGTDALNVSVVLSGQNFVALLVCLDNIALRLGEITAAIEDR